MIEPRIRTSQIFVSRLSSCRETLCDLTRDLQVKGGFSSFFVREESSRVFGREKIRGEGRQASLSCVQEVPRVQDTNEDSSRHEENARKASTAGSSRVKIDLQATQPPKAAIKPSREKHKFRKSESLSFERFPVFNKVFPRTLSPYPSLSLNTISYVVPLTMIATYTLRNPANGGIKSNQTINKSVRLFSKKEDRTTHPFPHFENKEWKRSSVQAKFQVFF